MFPQAAIHNQGAEILDSISLEEQAENSDNELSLVRQELLEIKKFIFTGKCIIFPFCTHTYTHTVKLKYRGLLFCQIIKLDLPMFLIH